MKTEQEITFCPGQDLNTDLKDEWQTREPILLQRHSVGTVLCQIEIGKTILIL
jgi:hypothetical protein